MQIISSNSSSKASKPVFRYFCWKFDICYCTTCEITTFSRIFKVILVVPSPYSFVKLKIISSYHCTQLPLYCNISIIKFNNSFRFSGGHLPSFEYDKKFDSSFMLEIKFIHDTNRINNKFYSFPPGNRHCETSGIWYLYSAQPVSYFYFVIFLFQQDFCSLYQTNFWQSVQFTNKKTPIFMLNLIFVHKQCMLLVTYMKYGLCCQYFQSLNQFWMWNIESQTASIKVESYKCQLRMYSTENYSQAGLAQRHLSPPPKLLVLSTKIIKFDTQKIISWCCEWFKC